MSTKVKGRYGMFTPRPDQAAFYAERAEAQRRQRTQAQRSLEGWLNRHRCCANGCGQEVAFYDRVHFSLKHSGCCSQECETQLAQKQIGGAA